MRALSAWIDRNENMLANLGAFIMTFLLLLFVCYTTKAGPPVNTQTVTLIERDKKGEYTQRIINIPRMSDAHATVCLRGPDTRADFAQCFFQLNLSNEVAVIEMKIVGEITS